MMSGNKIWAFSVLIRKLTQKDTSILHRCSSSTAQVRSHSSTENIVIFVMLQNQAAWVNKLILILPGTRVFHFGLQFIYKRRQKWAFTEFKSQECSFSLFPHSS